MINGTTNQTLRGNTYSDRIEIRRAGSDCKGLEGASCLCNKISMESTTAYKTGLTVVKACLSGEETARDDPKQLLVKAGCFQSF